MNNEFDEKEQSRNKSVAGLARVQVKSEKTEVWRLRLRANREVISGQILEAFDNRTMAKKLTEVKDLKFDQLREEAEEIRARINRFRTSLGRFFVNKQMLIDLMVVAAIAQEPLLLIGPPGTAKSDLVLKFKEALGISNDDYFEYMLTLFYRAI